jgi:hypothetical protein
VAFWEPTIQLGDEIEFQVFMRIPQTFADCQPVITQISLKFTSIPVLTIVHQPSQSQRPVQTLDVGLLSDESSSQALDLHVAEKSYWLITGRLKPSELNKIILEQVAFRFDNILNGRRFDFSITPDTPGDQALDPSLWIEHFDDTSHEPIFLHTESFKSACKCVHNVLYP